ncbi:unknown protein [Seminavis robusta]|uniref:Uncharacterized protein n=1 Tax=Seminavis robusta TaxID=568900 RepID=A0A9N8E9S1_9STRA|nr:unknown protein [Seminavis robusta]|eukprot:Sro665_g183791.1  (178) ;mRNA; f:11869-12402
MLVLSKQKKSTISFIRLSSKSVEQRCRVASSTVQPTFDQVTVLISVYLQEDYQLLDQTRPIPPSRKLSWTNTRSITRTTPGLTPGTTHGPTPMPQSQSNTRTHSQTSSRTTPGPTPGPSLGLTPRNFWTRPHSRDNTGSITRTRSRPYSITRTRSSARTNFWPHSREYYWYLQSSDF